MHCNDLNVIKCYYALLSDTTVRQLNQYCCSWSASVWPRPVQARYHKPVQQQSSFHFRCLRLPSSSAGLERAPLPIPAEASCTGPLRRHCCDGRGAAASGVAGTGGAACSVRQRRDSRRGDPLAARQPAFSPCVRCGMHALARRRVCGVMDAGAHTVAARLQPRRVGNGRCRSFVHTCPHTSTCAGACRRARRPSGWGRGGRGRDRRGAGLCRIALQPLVY